MAAARAARLGFRWKIGNGRKVRFWEDNWLGSSSLAIQFWKLYTLVNEKGCVVADVWNGSDLICTFNRIVDEQIYNMWLEVVNLASTIEYSDEEDTPIWMFNSDGLYSSQSLYKIINFRGVIPVHVSAVWSIKAPPRIHFFLWLLMHNKVLTRDNLSKKRKVEDAACLFCCEPESVQHLFSECVVAKQMWQIISGLLDCEVGKNLDSIGVMWLSNKRFCVHNMICAAGLWALWKLRNVLCFQNGKWRSMAHLLGRVAYMAQNWIILCPVERRTLLEQTTEKLKKLGDSSVIIL